MNAILIVQPPTDAWKYGKDIEANQDKGLNRSHNILFNKGRYFETSIYDKEVLNTVSELTGIPIQYTNMIVASWNKMEDFVAAMNLLGYRVNIDVDWI